MIHHALTLIIKRFGKYWTSSSYCWSIVYVVVTLGAGLAALSHMTPEQAAELGGNIASFNDGWDAARLGGSKHQKRKGRKTKKSMKHKKGKKSKKAKKTMKKKKSMKKRKSIKKRSIRNINKKRK